MKTVEHKTSFEMNFPVDVLFPLFSPEGEKAWVPGWDYQTPMETAELSEDYVFLTKSHDHGTTDAIWLVKKYEKAAHLIELYKIEPGEKVGLVKVKCSKTSAQRTVIEVTYRYLALSESGERFITNFTNHVYKQFIGEWQTLLQAYFAAKE